MNNSPYLGKGLVFPIKLTSDGLPIISSGEDLIKSSIQMILSTSLKQRLFLPEFGSRLLEILEEPHDDLLLGIAKHFIYEAIRDWEKRIDIIEISLARLEDSSMDVRLRYLIKSSNLEQILTFPFYKSTGNI